MNFQLPPWFALFLASDDGEVKIVDLEQMCFPKNVKNGRTASISVTWMLCLFLQLRKRPLLRFSGWSSPVDGQGKGLRAQLYCYLGSGNEGNMGT